MTVLIFLCTLSGASAAAQEPAAGVGTAGDCSPVIIDPAGDVTVKLECRLAASPKELKQLAAALSRSSERLSALPADLLDRHERLSRQFGIQEQALRTFFRILNEEDVPVEELDAKLREIAGRHRQALIRLGELDAADATVAALRDKALEALARGDYAAADAALKQAQDAQDKRLAEAEKAFLLAAELRASRADLMLSRSRAREAAALYLEAAALTPESRPREKAEYLARAGEMFKLARPSPTAHSKGDPELENLALKAFQRAVEILEAGIGPDHPETARALERLALMYFSLRRDDEAEETYRRALAIYEAGTETADGGGPSAVVRVLKNFANVYFVQGRFDEAAALQERALAILETAPEEDPLGGYHLRLSRLLSSLGLTYESLKRNKDAEDCYTRSLAVVEAAYGKDSWLVAGALDTLARLYEKQGRLPEAEALRKRSLTIHEKAGESDLYIAMALRSLAGNYRQQRRYKDAELLLKRALAIYEAEYGGKEDEVWLTLPLEDLAYIYELQQRYAEAEPLYKRAISLSEGPGYNSDLANGLQFLARLYIRQRRYKDAAPLLKRALAIVETCAVVKKHHPVTEHIRGKLKAVETCRRKPASCTGSREISPDVIHTPPFLPRGGCDVETAERDDTEEKRRSGHSDR